MPLAASISRPDLTVSIDSIQDLQDFGKTIYDATMPRSATFDYDEAQNIDNSKVCC